MLGEPCCIWRGAETPGRRIPTHCSGDIEKSASGLIGVWPGYYWARPIRPITSRRQRRGGKPESAPTEAGTAQLDGGTG